MDAARTSRIAYRFNGFVLDLARGALLAEGGAEVPLRAKSFALLKLFVESAGRLLDRDTIMTAVWPDVVVSDESIAQCVRDIRKALRDEAQQVLKTVLRRGYLFAAEVAPVDPATAVPRPARRLVAILAANMVGYSSLMGKDKPGTLARLKAHQEDIVGPLVARYCGRVVNRAGDSILYEFASVVEAVACAVAIQEGMADHEAELPSAERFRFRIGVNVDNIIAEGEDAYGDGVNIAARLGGLAEPGGICISGKVYDEIRGKLDLGFEDLGELALKNIVRPIRAWRVAEATPRATRCVAGLPYADPGTDPKRRTSTDGPTEGIIVDLARFRRGAPSVRPTAPDGPPLLAADHNLPQPNPNFVGRTTELTALRQALTASGRSAITQARQAISGLGGIGKTQLALAYAYAHLGDYDLVRWLHAEEPSVLAADYAGLAPMLGVDPRVPDETALVAAVRAKLERVDRYLLVFDNAADPGSLKAYLPRIGGGHALVTSRWQDWEGTAGALELELLPEAEAVALLLEKNADDPAERAAAAELAAELGCLPLALAQARAFMRARKVGIAGYRQQLTMARPKVLAWRPPNAGYPLALAQAWQASLDQATHDCPAARDLLQLLAFLGPDAIPRDLLGAKPEALPEGLRDSFDRDGAIEALGRFSLLRVSPESLTVHRLVQAVTREGLDEQSGGRCAATAVTLVDTALPRPAWEYDHLSVIGRLLPHALAAAEAAERFGIGLVAAATVLHDVATYHHARAAWPEAEPLLRRALAIRERTLGTEHPDFTTALNDLGMLYLDIGRYSEAKPLLQRVLAIRERTLGPQHPRVAHSLHNLGRLNHDFGHYAEAVQLFQRALSIKERTFGSEHPYVAISLSHLGGTYRDTGHYAEAVPLFQRALAIKERILGLEHPSFAYSLHNLGRLYQLMGRNAEAEPLLQRALAIKERTLDPEHPYVANSLNGLGELYRATARYVEAESLLKRALTLGAGHRDLVTSLAQLGGLYLDAGRHAEAEPLLQRALDISEQAYGPEHPYLATSLSNLGKLYHHTGRHAEAESFYQRSLQIIESSLAAVDPKFLKDIMHYADLLDQLGRGEDAVALRGRADAIRQRRDQC